MAADSAPVPRTGRGFVFGELLVAVLLLAIAVSSLAALMYSVSRRPEANSATTCVEKGSISAAKCEAPSSPVKSDRLLRSSCLGEDGSPATGCRDSGSTAPGGAVLK